MFFNGGSAQISNSFFFNTGWIIDLQPGNYYHDTFMQNCDAERAGPWLRSSLISIKTPGTP